MIRYFIGRVGSVVLTFLAGTSLLFVISRLSPTNPVDVIISKLTAAGAYLTPEAYESIKGTFMKLYGLEKPLFEQYVLFMRGLVTGDLGPSFSHFPTPVIDLIYRALPWTVGLLVVSIAIAWVLGNLIGVAAGYFEQKRFTKILEGGSLIVSLVPYPVIALGLAFLFIYFIPIFPFFGGMPPGTVPGFSLEFILGIVKHAFLPAFSNNSSDHGSLSYYNESTYHKREDRGFCGIRRAQRITPVLRAMALHTAQLLTASGNGVGLKPWTGV